MSSAEWERKRPVVAFIAALILFAQSSLVALAAGSMPLRTVDLFGNPLCIADSLDPDPSGDHAQQHCCILGCASAGTSMLPPRAPAWVPQPATASASFTVAHAAFAIAAAKHRPGHPRAPPSTV